MKKTTVIKKRPTREKKGLEAVVDKNLRSRPVKISKDKGALKVKDVKYPTLSEKLKEYKVREGADNFRLFINKYMPLDYYDVSPFERRKIDLDYYKKRYKELIGEARKVKLYIPTSFKDKDAYNLTFMSLDSIENGIYNLAFLAGATSITNEMHEVPGISDIDVLLNYEIKHKYFWHLGAADELRLYENIKDYGRYILAKNVYFEYYTTFIKAGIMCGDDKLYTFKED